MKALVLAGGFPQIALIEELKQRGIQTVLADWNENPVARKYADKYYRASTLDEAKIEEIAVDEAVDFIITVCTDQALLTVAKVSEKLGLPCYIDYQTALNVTNKSYMKEIFVKNDVPTAKHIIAGSLNEEAIEHMNFPLIVKPVDCNSSKGVRRVENIEELRQAFDDAVAMSRTDSAIVEEFITGKELSADFYISNGKAELLSVSESCKIKDKDKFVIFRALYPSIASHKLEAEIQEVGQKIADAFGITDSPMLVQMLVDNGRLNVIEFSARTGGGVKYLLIKHISGFDVIKAVVDLTLGVKPEYTGKKSAVNYLVNDFIYCKPGVFDHLDGFEELKAEGILKDYYQFKWQGAEFDSVCNSGDRVSGYTVVGETADELIEKHKKVLEKIRVIDNEGNDIARHDLLTDITEENGFIFSN